MFITFCKQLKLVNYSTDYSLIRRLHLVDSIHSDTIHFILIATMSFCDEKRLT